MVYVTKNKVKRIKQVNNSNYGIQLLKDIRWAMKNDPEFKKNYEQQLKKKKNVERRWENSIRRTRKRIQDILNANLDDKSYFLTLTFAENLQDYEKANAKFNYFIRIKNKDIKYLVVKEHQQRGAIHFHLIVFDIDKKDLLKLKSSWTYGHEYTKYITDKYAWSMANYMTKYFTKEKNQLVQAGKKIFSKSRNIKKPLIISKKVEDKILEKYNYDIDLENYNWLQHEYIIEEKPTHNLAVDFA